MVGQLQTIFRKHKEEDLYEWLYFISICVFIISLATSRWVLSVAQIMMSVAFLLSGNYITKIKSFKNNKAAVYLASIFLVYLLGMLWTEDVAFGLGRVIKNKLPFLTLVFLIAAYKPLREERNNFIPVLFALSLLFTSLYGLTNYIREPHIDPREMSPFFTHIHLSIMLVLMIFFLPWHVKRISNNQTHYYLAIICSVWFGVFIFMMSSFNGVLCLLISLSFVIIRYVFFKSQNRNWQTVFIITLLSGMGLALLMLHKTSEPVMQKHIPTMAELMEKTAKGNPYHHHVDNDMRENGYLVFYFIAEDELRESWNQRSIIDFDSTDKKGHDIKYTLYRYLTSKGLRKDAASCKLLNDEEIRAIENGTTNYLYTQWPNVMIRLHSSLSEIYEYRRTGNPTGQSLSQRLEIWRASWHAFLKHPFLGWGSGDVKNAMHYGLEQINSDYETQMRHVHNQYINILISLGLAGLIATLTLLFLFISSSKACQYLPFIILLIIFFITGITDSPLDSQMSLAFFLFFFTYFSDMLPRAHVQKR